MTVELVIAKAFEVARAVAGIGIVKHLAYW
jgi:hypothetical protein